MSQTSIAMESDCRWVLVDGIYVLSGAWDTSEVKNIQHRLPLPLSGKVYLHLDDVEIISGEAMAMCITWIRELCHRGVTLVLICAPQMLAHTLYKTNMLNSYDIELISPREDTGIGI